MRRSLFLPLLAIAVSSTTLAGDWPQFRGPTRDGVSAEKGWRSEWTGDAPIAWKAQVGLGFSALVVATAAR